MANVALNDIVRTTTDLFSNAIWSEREIYDLFGIIFLGNTDLRRLLTDYGFIGNPLRKDFPLSGYVELLYTDLTTSICYTPVELMQDYRVFNFTSPWEIIFHSTFISFND